MRIYKNYVSGLLELCRLDNSIESVGLFRKLYALLVLSGLLFLHYAEGVSWDLIDLVDDVDCMADYNWLAVIWQLLVDAIEEMKDKMRTTKYFQINGLQCPFRYGIQCFVMVKQFIFVDIYCSRKMTK